jgi:hypothetical protein
MIIGRFTKKLIVIGLFISLIVCGNFFLRLAHIKKIESTIDSLEEKLSNIGITLTMSNYKSKGIFFWDISLEMESEIYTTISDSIIYFYIKSIAINSLIDINKNSAIEVILPNKVGGRLEFSDKFTKELNIEGKYKVFIETENIPTVNITGRNLYSNDIISVNLNNLKIAIEEGNGKSELVFIENLNMRKSKLSDNETKLSTQSRNLNLYLDEAKFGKYLPEAISFKSGTNNIDFNLDLLISENVANNVAKAYDINLNFIAEAFKVAIDGQDLVIKNPNEREYHKSDFNLNIENFDRFIDYTVAMALISKDSDEEREELKDIYNLFRKIIKQYGRQSGDIMSFRIKDTDDKKTLFEGILIDEVFKEPIDKLKKMY